MQANGHKLICNVLIVDDDPDHLEVTSEYLNFMGATVEVAGSGIEGLRKLESYLPHIILLDLSMPGMDGWTMLLRLRGNPRTAEIPVIALTAHAMTDDKWRVAEAGFNGYLSKPFKLDELVEVMKSWIP